jgi:hypothetical protein
MTADPAGAGPQTVRYEGNRAGIGIEGLSDAASDEREMTTNHL